MSDDNKYVSTEVFNEYKAEARKSRERLHKHNEGLDARIQAAMLDCLKNGGGDVIRNIFKEELNNLGLHTDEQKELREDFGFLRHLRIRSKKNADVIWQTVIKHATTAAISGGGIFLLLQLIK